MTVFAYLTMAVAASAATTDLKEKRIPNRLVFPVMLIALIRHSIQHGLSGLSFSALGLLVGLFVFLLPFSMGAMGAGDVKLMAALGSLMGWRFILVTAIYTSMAGFFIAVAIIIRTKNWLAKPISYLPFKLSSVLAKLLLSTGNASASDLTVEPIAAPNMPKKEKTMIPYGLSIAVGVFIVLVARDIDGWPLMNFL